MAGDVEYCTGLMARGGGMPGLTNTQEGAVLRAMVWAAGAKTPGFPIRCYFTDGIPKSLQIFFAKLLFISVCLGTEDLLFCSGLDHHECRLPSLINSQP